MYLFPAIDLYGGKAVRLLRGDYQAMTVYSHNPIDLVRDFESEGARHLHLVDLEGAKTGAAANLEPIRRLVAGTKLFTQLGGGIRDLDAIARYLDIGVDRVILGTAAVTDPRFLQAALAQYGDKIAVGVDLREGAVAIRGWTETSALSGMEFCRTLEAMGVKTLICTDISKDGAMQGTNRALYRDLAGQLRLQIIASGGVSSLDDVRALSSLGLYGAIVGKAYYTGAISLRDAVEVAR